MVKMSDKEYFSHKALSNSDFRLLKESPLHLANKELFRLEGGSLTLGSAVHKLVLEPDSFNDDYIIEDFEGASLNKNSKEYKDAKAAWLESVGDRTVLSVDLFDQVTKMAKNVMAIAGGLLQEGIAEHAFFAEIEGTQCKCKADYFRPGAKVCFDLKTTKSIRDFERSILDYGYATQSAFYSDVITASGHPVERFVFILVETSAPYMVSVREMNDVSIGEGRAIYQKYMNEWKEYLNGKTPSVVKTTSLPEWYLEKVGAI